MSTDRELLQKIEHIINDFGAELTAQKVILQLLLAHMLVVTSMLAEETLEKMRTDVMDALEKAVTSIESR